jgi:hypothetical protein
MSEHGSRPANDPAEAGLLSLADVFNEAVEGRSPRLVGVLPTSAGLLVVIPEHEAVSTTRVAVLTYRLIELIAIDGMLVVGLPA